MNRCLVCGDTYSTKGAYTISDIDRLNVICPDCNKMLDTMIALVIVDPLSNKRTGENVFLGKEALKKYAPELTLGSDIYIISPSDIKVIVKRLMYERV